MTRYHHQIYQHDPPPPIWCFPSKSPCFVAWNPTCAAGAAGVAGRAAEAWRVGVRRSREPRGLAGANALVLRNVNGKRQPRWILSNETGIHDIPGTTCYTLLGIPWWCSLHLLLIQNFPNLWKRDLLWCFREVLSIQKKTGSVGFHLLKYGHPYFFKLDFLYPTDIQRSSNFCLDTKQYMLYSHGWVINWKERNISCPPAN